MKKIQLTKGKFALVDDEDFEKLSQYKWCFDGRYALRKGERMHRKIMNTPKEMQTDHINGDKLDNRKSNLRICSNRQNQRNKCKPSNNTSGYKGVSKKGNKWEVRISVNGRKLFLGYFLSINEASTVYNLAAKKYFGEFARPNKIQDARHVERNNFLR